jgi:protein O-mannosyl-transferase
MNEQKNGRQLLKDEMPRWRVPAVCLVLAAITIGVFWQAAAFRFVDANDDLYVNKNSVVQGGLNWDGVVWVFTHVDCDLYHPVTMLSLMGNYQLHGLRPGGYHLTNIMLHTASVILLFLTLRQMTGALWRSAFVAAVFAIHPLRVESVAWVAERKDVLGTFFFMLTLGAYVRYVRKPDSPIRYLMVAAVFVMALLSKPTAVTLPFVLLLLDYWPLQRAESRKLSGLILEKIPFLALTVAGCLLTSLAVDKWMARVAPVPLSLRIENAVISCAVYLRQTFWPTGLATFYPFPQNGVSPWEVALAGALLTGLSAVAWMVRRKQPWLLVGWLWYLGMLVPMIGIVKNGEFAHADRHTYLPQIGICLAVTWLVAEWRLGRAAFGCLMTGVLAALMVSSWNQTAYWQDPEALWTRALACTTRNDMAHNSLGAELLRQGKTDEAIAHFQEALRINPACEEARFNLDIIRQRRDRAAQLIHYYEKALQLDPAGPEVKNNLMRLLVRGVEAAPPDVSQPVKPGGLPKTRTARENPFLLHTLAAAFAQAGQMADARRITQRAMELARAAGRQDLAEQWNGELKRYETGLPLPQ